jgi:hypothetical protein
VIAAVFGHFRWAMGLSSGASASACCQVSASASIRTRGFADFSASPLTFSYRGLMIMPSAHFARDVRLTNGRPSTIRARALPRMSSQMIGAGGAG